MPAFLEPISINLLSRRSVIAGALVALVGSSGFSADADQATSPSPAANATRTSLHQEIDLKTTPARIYSALLDSKQFAAFSHDPAEIQGEHGGAFSLFGAKKSLVATSNSSPTSASSKLGVLPDGTPASIP